jgi:hypothetical protein
MFGSVAEGVLSAAAYDSAACPTFSCDDGIFALGVRMSGRSATELHVGEFTVDPAGWRGSIHFGLSCAMARPETPAIAVAPAIGVMDGVAGCASVVEEGGAETLRYRLFDAEGGRLTSDWVEVATVDGTAHAPSLHLLERRAGISGVAAEQTTFLAQVGFLAAESGMQRLRVAGGRHALNVGLPSSTATLTPHFTVGAPVEASVAPCCYVMTPLELPAQSAQLARMRDENGAHVPMRVVELSPMPLILLPAPPGVEGAGQQDAFTPGYTSGRSTGTSQGQSFELEVSVIWQVEATDPFFDLGVEIEGRFSESFGWEREKSYETVIEDLYAGTTTNDTVVVNRSTMWNLPYLIVESADGLGVGTRTEILAPRTTIVTVDTVDRLREMHEELFDGPVFQPGDWRGALPHRVGAVGSYLRRDQVEDYCDGTGNILRSLPHDVVEGSETAEGARITMSQEESTSQTVGIGISVDVVAGGWAKVGGGVSFSMGHSWGASIGSHSSFETWVGNIPYQIDSWDEEYQWQFFLCKRRLGPAEVWSANYAVGTGSGPAYQGRGRYVELDEIETLGPTGYARSTTNPSFEWVGGGSVDRYEVVVEEVGGRERHVLDVDMDTDRSDPTDVPSDEIQSASLSARPDGEDALTPGKTYRWRVRSFGYLENRSVSDWAFFVARGRPDLRTTIAARPDRVPRGGTVDLLLRTRNGGASATDDVAIDTLLPPGMVAREAVASDGGSCTVPRGDGGDVRCVWPGPTAVGAIRRAAVTAAVAPGVAVGRTLSIRSIATSAGVDLDPSDDEARLDLRVVRPACTIRGSGLVVGTSGDDVLCGSAGADRIVGGSGDDLIFGGGGDDELLGGSGDDLIAGDAGADTLVGSEGRDVLVGGAGRDDLDGGSESDLLEPGNHGDAIDGGSGVDTLSFARSQRAVTVRLGPGRSSGEGADTIADVEIVIGSRFDDLLVGSDVIEQLIGGDGDDRLIGEAGNDTRWARRRRDERRPGDRPVRPRRRRGSCSQVRGLTAVSPAGSVGRMAGWRTSEIASGSSGTAMRPRTTTAPPMR